MYHVNSHVESLGLALRAASHTSTPTSTAMRSGHDVDEDVFAARNRRNEIEQIEVAVVMNFVSEYGYDLVDRTERRLIT